MWTRRPVRADASAIAASSSGVHHCTPCGPYCTSNVALPAAAATASTSASCSAADRGVRMKRWRISSRASGGERGEDRLRRSVDQRIAVAHRDRKADPHADVARGARHLGGLGRQVGQPLRAGVVHHHHAGAAERAARQRDRAGEIGIDRRHQRQIVQPDLQRLAGGADASSMRTARAWSCALHRTGSASTGSTERPRAGTAAMRRRRSGWSARVTGASAAVSTCAQVSSRIAGHPLRSVRQCSRIGGALPPP